MNDITLKQLFDKYMSDRMMGPNPDVVSEFNFFFKDLQKKNLGEIKTSDVENCLLKFPCPDEAKKQFNLLKTLFFWAIEKNLLKQDNPLSGVDMEKVSQIPKQGKYWP